MSSPSAFDIGRQVGNNFAQVRNTARDEGAIEQILSEAMQSGDSAVLQNSIGKILSQVSPERQGVAVQYLQSSMAQIKEKQQQQLQKTAAQEGGYTYGAPPAVQSQQVKNQQPPSTLGGLSGRAVPANITKSLQDVVNNNFEATADELALKFDENQIPRAFSNSYIENRRRQDETRANNQREDKKISRNEELQFHKESEKFDEELMKNSRIAVKQSEAINEIDKAIDSKNVSPTSWSNIFKGFGKIGDKISEALLNKDEATLLASIPQLLEGWKEVFGVRLSDADLKVLQDKLPSIGKNPAANKSILGILKKYSDMTLLRGKIGEEVKKANKGLRPLGFASKVDERFNEMTQPVKIINPTNGREIEIPAYKLSEAIKSGAKLAPQSGGEQ